MCILVPYSYVEQRLNDKYWFKWCPLRRPRWIVLEWRVTRCPLRRPRLVVLEWHGGVFVLPFNLTILRLFLHCMRNTIYPHYSQYIVSKGEIIAHKRLVFLPISKAPKKKLYSRIMYVCIYILMTHNCIFYNKVWLIDWLVFSANVAVFQLYRGV